MAVTANGLPFVSVIVPVHNGADTIEACVRALLAQDYPADRREIIVVDNNSSDGTADAVRALPVRCVAERGVQSSYAARNAGVAAARGEVLAFTDADCVPAADWLRRGVAAFADESVGGVAGAIRPLPPTTLAQRYAVEAQALSQEIAVSGNSYRPAAYTANAFYRRAAWDAAGGFDPHVRSGGDADLAWRVQERCGLRIAYVGNAIVAHRHRESVRGLLRQRRLYGYGSVINYAKYRGRMARRTWRHAYWDARAFGRRLGRALAAGAACAVCLGRGGRRERAALAALDVLVFGAMKLGQWQAAIARRVWYL
jgi:cellulose synthase/poly-beta-1,6-N-acetylglucosamine synthase-like glycosyltransferase